MKYSISLLLLAAVLFLFALNHYQLRESTEPRVAGVDTGMLVNHDWVTPRLNGRPFLEKPPLTNWLGATSIQLLGANPFAVRLVSVIASLATTLTLFVFLLRGGQSMAQAWLAAMFLITMAQFWSNGRQVGEDALLTFGVSLCLLAFYATQTRTAASWYWLLFSAGLAIATLSKGLLGLAYPGAVVFAYWLSTTIIEKRFSPLPWLHIAIAGLMGLLPLLAWLVFLYQRNGIDAVTELLLANSVGRFSGDFDGNAHVLPFYFYLARLPELFLPWNILVFLGVWQLCKQIRQDTMARFLLCWLLAPLVLLSLSSGKRMVYALAIYPAAATIAAFYCSALLQRCSQLDHTHRWARRFVYYHRHITAGLLATVVAIYLFYAGIILPRQDQKESLMPVMKDLMQREKNGARIALYQPTERLEGAVVFYSQHNFPELHDVPSLQSFMADDARHVALVNAETPPIAGLKILSHYQAGKHDYLFVGQ